MRLTVRRRIILTLCVVSLVPLLLANVAWLLSSQAALRRAAANQQQLLVKSSADAVDSFLTTKIDTTIIHSQTAGVQTMDLAAAKVDLRAYLKQDEDLRQVRLIDAAGKQRLQVDRKADSEQAVNVSADDAFRSVAVTGGKEYVSPVKRDTGGNYVTLAVPLTNSADTQSGRSLPAAAGTTRPASDIKGVLVADVSVTRLWMSILSSRLGTSGYAYVVDDHGVLIAYPDRAYAATRPSLANVGEVKAALSETRSTQADSTAMSAPRPVRSRSEKGEDVLSSHYRVARTGWTVIAEEPISSVYEPVRNDIRLAFVFFGLTALVGAVMIALMARGLLKPVKTLADGAARFGSGDLAHRITLTQQDEFGTLAHTFNDMAAKIAADIKQLQQTDKLKNEFIMLASHNLRTPLAIIDGYIDMLKSQEIPRESREALAAIDSNVRQLSGFSETMLTISTIEAGSAVLSVSEVTVGELFEPLRTTFDGRAAGKGVRLTWDTGPAETKVRLSPVHIRSALSNLIGNALEFTGPGGLVDVNFKVEAERYVAAVRDTGSGITPEEIDQLFTKFHRGTDVLRYDHAGLGVGLYVTGLIVKAHGGTIKVDSQQGMGSVFTLTIPRPAESTMTSDHTTADMAS